MQQHPKDLEKTRKAVLVLVSLNTKKMTHLMHNISLEHEDQTRPMLILVLYNMDKANDSKQPLSEHDLYSSLLAGEELYRS